VTKSERDLLWFSAFFIVYHGLLFFVFWLVMDWAITAGYALCEPLRELLEMAGAQEADRRVLRQEEEAIRRYQEQLHQQREMAGRERNVEGLNLQNFSIKNLKKHIFEFCLTTKI
jgi:hypothetical protein